MFHIARHEEVTFSAYQTDEKQARQMFDNFEFNNRKDITKAMLYWWLFHNGTDQKQIDAKLDIEHILARRHNEKYGSVPPEIIEKLGNKALLETSCNIAASDYPFKNKREFYKGKNAKKGCTPRQTQNEELLSLCEREDFTEQDIRNRDKQILDAFFQFLRDQGVVSHP